MDIRRYRMPDRSPSKAHYSGLTADPFDPIESSQIGRGDLTGSSCLIRFQCSVSEKRASRRTQNSSCDTRTAHGDDNHLSIISARSLEPLKCLYAIGDVIGLECDLQYSCWSLNHPFVDSIEIVRADEVVVGTNNSRPINLLAVVKQRGIQSKVQFDIKKCG